MTLIRTGWPDVPGLDNGRRERCQSSDLGTEPRVGLLRIPLRVPIEVRTSPYTRYMALKPQTPAQIRAARKAKAEAIARRQQPILEANAQGALNQKNARVRSRAAAANKRSLPTIKSKVPQPKQDLGRVSKGLVGFARKPSGSRRRRVVGGGIDAVSKRRRI